MATIVTRAGKGSPLTNTEVDANFTNLNADKLESSSYTASDVLTKIKTVDGTGSGLDADLLDGNQATAFATAAQGSLADSAVQNLGDLGITSTSSELNTLDGFTGTKDDLNYAKDLRATGVTSTEYDYLDGVTSNIQTQLDNKLADSNPILDAISETIADTAVDIFIYDTRKDSDGGAWRKRTQHTSWYNETLNTATRGSRKEFPAVAVIVAENETLTIYDGDDPSLPMWMVFNVGSNFYIGNGNTATSVAMLNSTLVRSRSTNGIHIINFIEESVLFINSSGGTYTLPDGISGRNTDRGFTGPDASTKLVNNSCNDIAMTVLPNAPIDSATGLPVPTIAVATNGGVSVIRDDGTVKNSAASNQFNHIAANKDGFAYGYNSYENYVVVSYEATATNSWSPDIINIYYGGSGGMSPLATAHSSTNATDALAAYTQGNNIGLANYDVKRGGGEYEKLFNYITSSYNTGWMNGDIKLATLSDTDDTDVTGSELVTNGTFDSDTTGWTASNATVTNPSSQIGVETSVNLTLGWAYQAITCVVGKTYTLSCDFISGASNKYIYVSTGIGATGTVQGSLGNEAVVVGTNTITFTATATTLYVSLGSYVTGTVNIFDNVSVRLAEPDRSVNGNGLQVFGTVTKTPVATGADLVAYSGFSNSTNYLKQPYNSDLEIGSGDISFSVWIYPTAYTGYPYVFARGNNLFFYLYVDGNIRVKMGSTLYSSTVVPTNTWSCVTVVKRSGVITIYLNGNESESGASTDDITAVDTPLYVGVAYDGLNNFLGKISLLRISATAPSAEQIKKIYEDEKVLFQENAQATLYGSSDAVTALAYDDDTELLHVGTSAGRSVFQGLRRVDNTTDAVGAAISASGGMVADD